MPKPFFCLRIVFPWPKRARRLRKADFLVSACRNPRHHAAFSVSVRHSRRRTDRASSWVVAGISWHECREGARFSVRLSGPGPPASCGARPASGHALDPDLPDYHILQRPVLAISRRFGDLPHDFVARNDLPENGMPVVEVRRGRHGDKKLAAVRIRASVRHGQNARLVVAQFGMKLIIEAVARAAAARSLRTPSLDHKARNEPVKNQPVVKRLALGPFAPFEIGRA